MSGNTKSGRGGKKPNNKIIGKPEPPEHLGAESLLYWDKVCDVLIDRQAYDSADSFALERLAWIYGQWKELERYITKKGMTYEGKTDRGGFSRTFERPEAKLLLSLNKEIKDLERQFGLTPLSRKDTPKAASPIGSVRDKYK